MLWGKYDDKTSTGTVQIFANGLVTGTSTKFDTESEVGDYIKAGNKEYRIISITSNTNVQVVAGTLGAEITAVNSGTEYTLSEKPIYVSAASVGEDANNVFGVNTGETAANPGVAHAGWVRRTDGTGGRAGRVQFETLVAGSSITNDAADDTKIPDYFITISTQPADAEAADSEEVTFSVVAASTPSGATLGYQWAVSSDDGENYSDISGATSASYVHTAATAEDGYLYRVTVSATGANSVVSSAATLTISA